MSSKLVWILVLLKLSIASKNQDHLPSDHQCWGYEEDCEIENSYSKRIQCSSTEDAETFYQEADFGYVRKRLDTMQTFCKPRSGLDGFLKCSEQLQHCSAKDLWIDFRDIPQRKGLLRYSSDVLKRGQIRARCEFDAKSLKKEMIHMGVLQSWANEMQNFVPFDDTKNDEMICDVKIQKPTLIMKLDATVNMYHHLCDFFNLYSSLHINGSFSRDVQILIWENVPYRSSLSDLFEAFTIHPILNLNSYAGSRVCFSNAVFPLLPRMIYGLFYNTPLSTNDCQNSGLFKAFNEFVTSRLDLPIPQKNTQKIRVTILARQTRFRRIINLGTLEKILMDTNNFEITIAPFTHSVPFKDQLEIMQNTDILVGIHGAGLAHMLFLPDWAAVFELYDCEDPSCYRDLAKFRGLFHLSWSDKNKLFSDARPLDEYEIPEVSAKFNNYAFDPNEFLTKVNIAANHVKSHPQYPQNTNRDHDEL